MESVISPDGRVCVSLDIDTASSPSRHMTDQQHCLFWQVTCDGKPVVEPSRLGLELGGAAEFNSCFRVADTIRESHDSEWQPVYGERETVRDRFNGMTVCLDEFIPPYRTLELEFRAYNEGAALRYRVPEQSGMSAFSITREKTEFIFPEGTEGYVEYHVEGEYHRMPVEALDRTCERPLTLVLPGARYACLLEAHVDTYSRMLLGPAGQGRCGVKSAISGTVQAQAPFATPWRVVMIADDPGGLLEQNDLVLTLNPPCAIAGTSWIKPGKTIREVTLSTPGGMACVDFAVERGLDYIHFDAGWYGHEYIDEPDATCVAPDPSRVGGIPDYDGLDLPAVISYARSKGIGVWLYVNRRHLERQYNELMPLYEKWGVKGIKPGFVQVGPQEWTMWLHDVVRKAAEHHIMVDVHDGYRPTGFSRTHPNLLTQEGVRGNEHMPTARHNCTLPFCRYPAGAADYTPCYYNGRVKNTHAHQLALPVVFYSPAMFLFWYDKPSAYQGEPEVEFWRDVPTTWDDTRVLAGAIGEYVSVARRSGDVWYVGTITNEEDRELAIDLSFLQPARAYTAEIYEDGDLKDDSRTHVRIRREKLTADDTISADLPACGGQGIRLSPV
ncbi:MAG: alpha-glucosidase [Lentisphaerae bacterium]|jgi:alpha-glucosidase|nr:alpha-glucosidase [Lentisphaerota bacterium]MBT4823228.1 alpha-glucosidase [Lentisphaerota bacterium]MBT5607475.1 alpha-glucosidase [Lentisphaerota bacterium]MBT7055755.1 alpha-glucosidase [Lentisphaerota bacterium]MBT7843110.1 alpha-glucosidase [Lentisphaerota bacterium]